MGNTRITVCPECGTVLVRPYGRRKFRKVTKIWFKDSETAVLKYGSGEVEVPINELRKVLLLSGKGVFEKVNRKYGILANQLVMHVAETFASIARAIAESSQ